MIQCFHCFHLKVIFPYFVMERDVTLPVTHLENVFLHFVLAMNNLDNCSVWIR